MYGAIDNLQLPPQYHAPPVISMYVDKFLLLGDQCVPFTHRNEISIIQLAKHYLKIANVPTKFTPPYREILSTGLCFLFSVQSFTF